MLIKDLRHQDFTANHLTNFVKPKLVESLNNFFYLSMRNGHGLLLLSDRVINILKHDTDQE